MSKRIRYMFSIAAVTTLVLAACGPAATTQAPQPTEAPATSAPTTAATTAPTEAATAAATEAPTQGAVGDIDCMGAQSGDTITMIYQWADTEEAALNSILQPLVDACGIVIQPETTRDQALLDTRVQGGNPPDIAFWNVTQLNQYKDSLQALDELGADRSAYNAELLGPATIDGRWLGLPVKADVKTIIWYSPAVFDAKGYAAPTTWEELDALVEEMVANGDVPWAMGMESGDATGWTGSDFIQDILLVQQGPDYVNGLIDGSIPYNDAGVAQAYETYARWATDPAYTVGGAEGTLSTPFGDALLLPFSDPPQAMMVKQSGFVGGEVKAAFPDLEFGVDYDFFQVPDAQGLQGGSDWMMAFNDTPAVRALVAYLSSAEGGANWAAANFGLSPNQGAVGNYTDATNAKLGELLASASALIPDIGDTIPGGFGSAEWTAIVNYVNGEDLAEQLDQAEQVQQEAVGAN